MFAFFIVTGGVFLIVGLRALLKPIDAVAIPFSLQAEGADALNYLRSGTGGVTLACGTLILAAAWLPQLQLPALWLTVTVLSGLLFGRLVSRVIDGKPGLIVSISAIFEALGLLSGLYWLLITLG